ncbi:MAG: hypothetical protein KBA40_02110 [Candidatus Peribacteraceae bacterium]|nr:hypothetical protein [Candidatus Peribacteraceae bacterium]
MLESTSAFLASDPAVLAVQGLMAGSAFIVVFLVLFTTRDILFRTNSFLLQTFCILLTAVLPIIGFFIYLLIRPPRTIAERAMHRDIIALMSKLNAHKKVETPKPQEKSHKSQVRSHKT